MHSVVKGLTEKLGKTIDIYGRNNVRFLPGTATHVIGRPQANGGYRTYTRHLLRFLLQSLTSTYPAIAAYIHVACGLYHIHFSALAQLASNFPTWQLYTGTYHKTASAKIYPREL